MKFKVLKGTELFNKLSALDEEVNRCVRASQNLVESLGYKQFRPAYWTINGGISSIIIPGGKPAGWKNAHKDYTGEYMPAKNKGNKELLDKIAALPVVTYGSLNSLVGLDTPWGHPGFSVYDDYALINFSEKQIKSLTSTSDMIEITHSEWVALKGDGGLEED